MAAAYRGLFSRKVHRTVRRHNSMHSVLHLDHFEDELQTIPEEQRIDWTSTLANASTGKKRQRRVAPLQPRIGVISITKRRRVAPFHTRGGVISIRGAELSMLSDKLSHMQRSDKGVRSNVFQCWRGYIGFLGGCGGKKQPPRTR